MATTMVLIQAKGQPEEVSIDGYQDLNKAIGGYIELVAPIPNCKVMGYAREDGRLVSLPVNTIASKICGYQVVGDVIFFGGLDDEGNELPLTVAELMLGGTQ